MATLAATSRRTVSSDPAAPVTVLEAEDIHAHMRSLEENVGTMGDSVGNIASAVFGNPMDQEDHGLVGAVREVGRKLDRMFHSILALMGTLIVVAVTVSLALR